MLTGGIQRTSRKQIYYELDLYSLVKTHWYNKLVFLKKNNVSFTAKLLYSHLDLSSQVNSSSSSSTSIIRPVPTRTKS